MIVNKAANTMADQVTINTIINPNTPWLIE